MDRKYTIISDCDPLDVRAAASVIACLDAYNDELASRYTSFRQSPGGSIGVYDFHSACVARAWGGLFSQSGSIPLLQNGLGWQHSHLEYWAKARALSLQVTTPSSPHVDVSYIKNKYDIKIIDRPSALISFPGELTFDHWIVDIIGCLELIQNLLKDVLFICPPHRPWMERFFGLYNIRPKDILHIKEGVCYQLDKLYVPTTMGHLHGGTLPVEYLKPVFSRIRRSLHDWIEPLPIHSKGPLLILHTPQTSAENRSILNINDLNNYIIQVGGHSINPLSSSPYQLIQAINQSSIVIGQDSSALHNLIFAKPKPLIVLESQVRANLFHACLQEINNSIVSYFQCSPNDGNVSAETSGYNVDIASLANHTNMLQEYIAGPNKVQVLL